MEASALAANVRSPEAGTAAAVEDDLLGYSKPGVPVVEHDGEWHTLH